ncbi:ABC transporter ATP-binding protein [Sporolactobacillus nakayamae]|uniref:Energy-coupling factor transport system ATP-binding protein n=1 Tax=Sporolactobacillus nakayamae TaxID=269670 RepID=A0A1I2SVC4_9BACL|nr:ABC transporter ATP-binding protein [Sporolactobacillus nakayamae]SFG56650.1 energy-coupling factor transport system ATP-binding protein [Sporolactobacillus nakayamae]
MIELKNVAVRTYQGAPILSNFSLTVAPGELVVLSGPSGGGKSTVIRLINGLIYMDDALTVDGEAEIDHAPIEKMHSWDRSELVGSVFQDPRSQFFASVVKDELAFYCENFGMEPRQIEKRIQQAAEEQGLIPLLDHRIMTLSSGEKQKVAIASVRVARQKIYVLDEPSANLNATATAELTALLMRWKAEGHTIVLAEHRLHYLIGLLDRMVYVNDGRAVRSYSRDELANLSSEQLAGLGLRHTNLNWDTRAFRLGEQHGGHILTLGHLTVNGWGGADPLLRDLDLSIRSGELVMLTGANGIGKTSLARVLCGLSKNSEGMISVDGMLASRRKRSRLVWYVMQEADYQLFGESVWEELFVGVRHVKEMDRKAERILRDLELWALRDRHPSTLSGGEKQRVTLAVALMSNASVIILDEPTSGLDWKNLKQVAECLKREAEKGRIFLVITHDYELISEAGTRLIHLRNHAINADFPLNTSSGAYVLDLLAQDE